MHNDNDNNNDNHNIYSVRRPGCAAWADGLTQEEAEREVRNANRICCPGHRVVAHYSDGSTEWQGAAAAAHAWGDDEN